MTRLSSVRTPQTVTYLVTPIAGGGSGDEDTIVLTVANGNAAPIAMADTIYVV